jgi:hypothetical protein
MNRIMKHTAVVMFCTMATALAPVLSAEEAPELELKPCTIQLVDGTNVEGRLAVQFDMNDHLIVYSPRLATMRSFLKRHVHALTVDGKRQQLNAKRELTDADRKLLGQVRWPDEPPAEGHKPAYTTEKWGPPKYLCVWKHPGKSGRGAEPENWLVNGRPTSELPASYVSKFQPAGGVSEWGSGEGMKPNVVFGRDVDILFPCSESNYQGQAKTWAARHVTVGNNARFGTDNTPGVTGNVWIMRTGRHGTGHAYMFTGDKHTFFYQDKPKLAWGKNRDDTPHRGVARYIYLVKSKTTTVEFLGSLQTTDEFHVKRGTMLVHEDSQVMPGARATAFIHPEGELQLQSGAYFGKFTGWGGHDTVIHGKLRAGSPERPITRDCHLGIAYNDWQACLRAVKTETNKKPPPWRAPFRSDIVTDWSPIFGLLVMKDGEFRVHSSDPAKARMVIQWTGRHGYGDFGYSRPDPKSEAQLRIHEEQIQGRINAAFLGDVQLNGVVFDHFHRGGIMLADMNMVKQWKNVSFGEHNDGKPNELFVPFDKHITLKGVKPVRADWDYGENPSIPTIAPPPGVYRYGEKLSVTLKAAAQNGAEIRYTLDGMPPQANSRLYSGPITVTASVVVKARCFKNGQRLGPPARAKYSFEVMEAREPDKPGSTEPGLKYAYYTRLRTSLEEAEPTGTGTAGMPSYSVIQDAMKERGETVVFSGYLRAPKEGVYRFYTRSKGRITNVVATEIGGESYVFIGERKVVQNVWPYRDYRKRRQDQEVAGSAVLKAGIHAIKIVALRCPDGFDVSWQGPGIKKQPIPAAALSH